MNTMNFGPLITQLQESSSKTRGSKTLVLSAVHVMKILFMCPLVSVFVHPSKNVEIFSPLYAFVSEMIQDTDHLAKQNASLIGAVIY